MPRRRCVGCGRIAPKSELLRIALVHAGGARGGRAVLDRTATMPGRGAYLCADAEADAGCREPLAACLALAVRRRAIARALRGAVTIDPKLLESVGR